MHTPLYYISVYYLMTNIYTLPLRNPYFFLYCAHALYQFCYTKYRASLPPPPFYKRKNLKYVPSKKYVIYAIYIYIPNIIDQCIEKAYSTPRGSQAVPHLSTNRALRCLTAEFGRDPVCSTRYGRKHKVYLISHLVESIYP